MVSLWPWKGEDNSPASFEKTLSTLSTKINESTTRLDATRQQGRRFKALWTLYSIFIYLLYTTIDVLVLGWQNWGPWEYGAVLGGPFVVYGVRTLGGRVFEYRISKTQRYLDGLKIQRDQTIEKLKDATKYNSTQQLLEKYASDSSQPKTLKNNASATKRKDNGSKAGPAPMTERTGIPPPPTANIRRPQNEPPVSPPTNSPPSPHPPNYVQGKPLPPPPPPPQIDQPGFAPNAFPAPPQYNDGPKWYDRFMDVLLGEDETLPKNRLVLICQNCRLVNGQAPPGIKNLEELGQWRCGGCGAWNGEESEAKKVLETIKNQPPATDRTEDEENSLDESTDDVVLVEDASHDEKERSGDAEDDEPEPESAQEEPEKPSTRKRTQNKARRG
ncbi:hypothetical protein BGW36DRAFT_350974 [Talaromyces proteolyticus]|uniref:Endoplasmic reticulum junction formation protein lunapark n=1 Tax=Talaromyces proteolyticus TaxID=1131652 RepID=A0AAD4KI67_9EURO|nr:uncharacterized protein BGW36DRAFT_350974 [Talaromyces proteolyticus]KAH8689960.1 hypothetical protein BGW36DRAFT_350974 [Talaromyces proteolyticus]